MQGRNSKALIRCIVAGTILAFLPSLFNVVGPPRLSPATVHWWDLMEIPGMMLFGGAPDKDAVPSMFVAKAVDCCFYSLLMSPLFWLSWWRDRRNWKALATCIAAGTFLAFLPDIFYVTGAPHDSWTFLFWKEPGRVVANDPNYTPNMIVVNTVDLCFYSALVSPIVGFFWWVAGRKATVKGHHSSAES